MSSVHKYIIYGPGNALRRMPSQLYENMEPKYLYKYDSTEHNDIIEVVVFEEYEKQINSSVTLTCIFTYSGKKTEFVCKKTGGRMGFRGSSLDDEKRTIEDNVINFIMDYSKRSGLTVQQESKQKRNENSS